MSIAIRYYVFAALCGYPFFPILNYFRRKSGGLLTFRLWRDYILYAACFFAFFLILYLLNAREKKRIGDLKKTLIRNPALIFLLLLAFWIILSVCVTGITPESLIGVYKSHSGPITSLIYLLLFVMALLVRNEKLIRIWTALFLTTGFVSFLITVFEYYVLGSETNLIGILLFYNSNHLAYYLLTATVCAMGTFLLAKGKKSRAASILVFFAGTMALLIADALGCIAALVLSLVFSVIVMLLTGRFCWKRYLILIAAVCAALLLLAFVPNAKGKTKKASFLKNSSDMNDCLQAVADPGSAPDSLGSGRLRLWKCAVSSALEKPVFGYGPANMRDRLEEVSNGGSNTAHNEFLEYCSNYGIPALLFYAAFLMTVFLRGAKHRKELTDLNVISLCTAFAYLVSSFAGVMIFYTAPYLFLFLAFGYYRADSPVS